MQAPEASLRLEIATQAKAAKASENEDDLEDLLARLEDLTLTAAAVVDDNQAPDERLAAVEAWASIASFVVAVFYAPESPWRDEAGWSDKAVERLRRIAHGLRDQLQAVMRALGASGFSISVGFPWGLSVGISW